MEKIAIIAGGGKLPLEVADGAARTGIEPFVVGINGEAGAEISAFDHEFLSWGQLGTLFGLLKERGISHAVFAGSVKRRPDILKMKLDWVAVRSLPQVIAFMLGGDNSLLSGAIKLFESHGVAIVGAHQVVPDLLAPQGLIAGRKPTKAQAGNLERAMEACRAIGKLDIGQAAIAEHGRVVALEGLEGTDGMIRRVRELREAGRLPADGKDGVLVKTKKPGQEVRADLPSIGPSTIEACAQAGLKGIAVEAGASLILSRGETIAAARAAKLFIIGVAPQAEEAGS